MDAGDQLTAHGKLIEDLSRLARRMDAPRVVSSLDQGLTLLRERVLERAQADVKRNIGTDSFWGQQAEPAMQYRVAAAHVELYYAFECAAAAERWGYVPAPGDWFLSRLIALRVGPLDVHGIDRQRERYASLDEAPRRLDFTDVLMRVLRESSRTPLVLFRLLPLAVHIATALAFDDRPNAEQLRIAQAAILPAISDCVDCRGQVLDNGQSCPKCGNPIWIFEWLNRAD